MNDPRITHLLTSLDSTRRALHDAVARVTAARRQERPAPNRWSVAEVLEHLAIVEGRVTGVLEKFVATAPQATSTAQPPADYSALLAALADRTRTVVAPEFAHPTATLDATTAWAELERVRVQFKASLAAAHDRDLTGMSRQHPILGTLNGYEWIASLGGHEARHTEQIREIAEALA
jgi:DinB family protein